MQARLHPDVQGVLDELESTAPATAGDAAAALEWLLGDRQGVDALTQLALQQFLWYELPYTWVVPRSAQEAVAGALARFFDLAGLDRYAQRCRSPATDTLLATWEVDAARGFAAFEAASEASGVVPPDLDVLRWGGSMGEREHAAYWQVAAALELAAVAGELRPGASGARRRRRRVARAHLLRARPEQGGESLLQSVQTERIERWATSARGGARLQLVHPVVNQVLAPVEVPDEVVGAVAPLADLLALGAAGGVACTDRGYVAPAAVADIVARHPSLAPVGSARRELDVPALGVLRTVAVEQGWLRVGGPGLVASVRGATLAGDHAALLDAVGHALVARRGLDAMAGELLLASLLVEGRLPDADRRWEVAVALTQEGWAGGRGGRPLDDTQLGPAWRRIVGLGAALDLVEQRRHRMSTQLTPAGRVAARIALRARATAPAPRPRPR